MKTYKNIFNDIISLENLFLAWDKFKGDKQKKKDVQQFEWKLEENIFQLYGELKNNTYKHGAYVSFHIHDPKQRQIHKAVVRDRVLHHAVFNVLNPIFEPTFISHSFSCRLDKGTHKGVEAMTKKLRQVSRNGFKPCFVLKCDIKKFFETVDHSKLLRIIRRKIKDKEAMQLLEQIIGSFSSKYSNIFNQKGLPIGNLTSQLFANIYLNGFDQFIKGDLKVKNYIRYTDDFVIISRDRKYLENLIISIRAYLSEELYLELHPKKVSIRKFSQGIDFLGYVTMPHHSVLRTKTKRRIFRKLKKRVDGYLTGAVSKETLEQSIQSYLGTLSHANTYRVSNELKNQFWFWLKK
ncbi:Reverse transcriptase (RNA-dependent DNA polymerase) [uncultured archaeon]|nr:Reverse transcriptase (RNA-dependent DNA polymerase) [uncultured archaeon]